MLLWSADDKQGQRRERWFNPAMDQATSLTPELLAQLRAWEGRSETLYDEATAAPVRNLCATLDRDDPQPVPGTELPQLWHWLYFLPGYRHRDLAEDGHGRRGDFLPPVPLPRRMWAGGRLTFKQPLRVGEPIERTSRVVSVEGKEGRTGNLVFVLVRHEIANPAGVAILEEHDIVYRDMPAPGAPQPAPQRAPSESAWERTIKPDDVLLFRYSALTFNSHRIHYDRRYVTEVEGYPGLVVHGPLIATLLVDLVRRQMPKAVVAGFTFRAVRPTFDIASFSVCGNPSEDGKTVRLWAKDADGYLTMEATATLA
jgi:3-methylfumaryl-CoA hydratase